MKKKLYAISIFPKVFAFFLAIFFVSSAQALAYTYVPITESGGDHYFSVPVLTPTLNNFNVVNDATNSTVCTGSLPYGVGAEYNKIENLIFYCTGATAGNFSIHMFNNTAGVDVEPYALAFFGSDGTNYVPYSGLSDDGVLITSPLLGADVPNPVQFEIVYTNCVSNTFEQVKVTINDVTDSNQNGYFYPIYQCGSNVPFSFSLPLIQDHEYSVDISLYSTDDFDETLIQTVEFTVVSGSSVIPAFGSVGDALRTKFPFAYMYDIADVFFLSSYTPEMFDPLVLDIDEPGFSFEATLFSASTLENYFPEWLAEIFRGIVALGIWSLLGFSVYTTIIGLTKRTSS